MTPNLFCVNMMNMSENIHKKRVSGVYLVAMQEHPLFWPIVEKLRRDVEKFLTISEVNEEKTPIEIQNLRQLFLPDTSTAIKNKIRFLCEEVEIILERVKAWLQSSAKNFPKQVWNLEKIVWEIEESIKKITEESVFDTELLQNFKDVKEVWVKKQFLEMAKNRVLTKTTIKDVFKDIISLNSTHDIQELFTVFFDIQSVRMEFTNMKSFMSFVASITWEQHRDKQWKEEVLELFLYTPQVRSFLLSLDENSEILERLKSQIKAEIINKFLDGKWEKVA